MKAYVWEGDDKDAKMDEPGDPGRPQGAAPPSTAPP